MYAISTTSYVSITLVWEHCCCSRCNNTSIIGLSYISSSSASLLSISQSHVLSLRNPDSSLAFSLRCITYFSHVAIVSLHGCKYASSPCIASSRICCYSPLIESHSLVNQQCRMFNSCLFSSSAFLLSLTSEVGLTGCPPRTFLLLYPVVNQFFPLALRRLLP